MALDLIDYKFYYINVSSSEQNWQKGVVTNFPMLPKEMITNNLILDGDYVSTFVEGDLSITLTVTAGVSFTVCQINYNKSTKQWSLSSSEQFYWSIQNRNNNEVNILCSLDNNNQS